MPQYLPQLLIFAWSLTGHPIPDDTANRGVQIDVRPESVKIEYQLGLNDKMLAAALRKLVPDKKPPADASLLLTHYGRAMLPVIAQTLEIRVDGRRIELRPLLVSRLPGHHFRLQLVFSARHEANGRANMHVHDRSFAGMDGQHRMALTGRGGAKVTKSTAPPALVRVPPVPLSELPPERRGAARLVEAELLLPAAERPPQESEPSVSSKSGSRGAATSRRPKLAARSHSTAASSEPSPGRADSRLWAFVAVAVVIAAGFAVFWLLARGGS